MSELSITGVESGLSRRTALRGLGAGSLAAVAAALAPNAVFALQESDAATVEANKALVVRVFDELINKKNIGIIVETFAPDFVNHFAYPDEGPDDTGVAQGLPRFAEAFPDLAWQANEVIGEGNLVMLRATFTGTHQGEWQGIPPTGIAVTFESFHLARIDENGKLAEHWGSNDGIGIFEQLGLSIRLVPGDGADGPAFVAQEGVSLDVATGIADRLVGRFNAGDVAGMAAVLADDVAIHWPWPVPGSGPAYIAGVLGLFRVGFPDATLKIDEIFVAGDRSVVRATATGTHTGRLLGVPVTGREINFSIIIIGRIVDGKVAEIWAEADLAAVVIQLGNLGDTVGALLTGLGGAAPATPATSATLADLVALDGVGFALEFGADGTIVDYQSEIDIPQEEVEQAAAAGPLLNVGLAVAADRYSEISALNWGPPHWLVYSGGDRWTVVLAGNRVVIAETATVDFNALYAALVGPRG